MAPQGCLNLRLQGLTFKLTPPLTNHCMLAVLRRGQGFGRDDFLQLIGVLPRQKSSSAESLLPPTTPATGEGSGSAASAEVHLSSMSETMFAIAFPPWRNGLALNVPYPRQLADCWWFQQNYFSGVWDEGGIQTFKK